MKNRPIIFGTSVPPRQKLEIKVTAETITCLNKKTPKEVSILFQNMNA